MSRLSDIPIRVEGGCADSAGDGTIGGVSAILAEIAERLTQLAAGGEPSAIDLRSLPMNPDERQQLIDALGPGELDITLRADGESAIRETGISGVWWNEYRDRGGELVADFIEIARVPAILPAADSDLRLAAQRLRERLAGRPIHVVN